MALNLVGGLCALLILCDIALAVANGRLNQSVANTHAQMGQAQQIQTTFQNLVVRVGQAGRTDPVLRNLLDRHDIRLNLDTNSPARAAR